MAKKKINLMLILIVLGLWGTVGYKALNRQFTGNEMVLKKQNPQGNIIINQDRKSVV